MQILQYTERMRYWDITVFPVYNIYVLSRNSRHIRECMNTSIEIVQEILLCVYVWGCFRVGMKWTIFRIKKADPIPLNVYLVSATTTGWNVIFPSAYSYFEVCKETFLYFHTTTLIKGVNIFHVNCVRFRKTI